MEEKPRAVIAQIRTGSTQARGDKIFKEKTGCRCCREKVVETIHHLLLDCKTMKRYHENFWENRPKPRKKEKRWKLIIDAEKGLLNLAKEVELEFKGRTKSNLFYVNKTAINKEEWEKIVQKAQKILEEEARAVGEDLGGIENNRE